MEKKQMIYEPSGVHNGLTCEEKKLLEELKKAEPSTRFAMCCNLARRGNWTIIHALGDITLLDRVRQTALGNNLDLDTSTAAHVPIKVPAMLKAEWDRNLDIQDEFGDFETFAAYRTAKDRGLIKKVERSMVS